MAWTPASQPGGMNEIVVDTDVISFIFKGHTIGSRYEADLSGRVCLISFMTVAELARWAIERNWSPQRNSLAAYIFAAIHGGGFKPRPMREMG
jgi:predicted nucleic acid-binding protein